jgi:hypothetical protein
MSGGVLGDRMTSHIGEEIPQVRVAHVVPLGGVSGGVLGDRMTCGSNTIRGGQEGNATRVACGSKPGVASGGNSLLYGQETNAELVACGSKPGVGSGSN